MGWEILAVEFFQWPPEAGGGDLPLPKRDADFKANLKKIQGSREDKKGEIERGV